MQEINRDIQVHHLLSTSLWDILIIGGGASGLGVALDAAARGYKTLLVEQCDFAKGTSSRSTKLIHGGVRYLAQGHVRLVRQASVERGLLRKNAPHLVKTQSFIIPVYNWWEGLKFTFGLKMYDWIAGKLTLGPSTFISREATIAALPGIRKKGLVGGVLYYDGQFDDSRLAINLMQTIITKGGCAINYMKVTGLLKQENGRLEGVLLKCAETGATFQAKAKAVVNATGVFVDDILKMDKPGAEKTICVSQGVHLVLDRKFFPSAHALMIPETSDGRVLFALPWYDKVVIGTTDTPVGEASLEPRALDKEIDFILETASGYLATFPARKDILSVFAGLRPLAVPKKGFKKTKEISRNHRIVVAPSGLFTMLGGKWTTFRKMGEDMVDQVERHFGWKHRKTHSATMPLHGYQIPTKDLHPFSFYGSDAAAIWEGINSNASEWISEKLKIHKLQVLWAVEKEMARTVEDVLSRRTRALFLDAEESIRICHSVANYMAAALGKDQEWIEKEVKQYTQLAGEYLV